MAILNDSVVNGELNVNGFTTLNNRLKVNSDTEIIGSLTVSGDIISNTGEGGEGTGTSLIDSIINMVYPIGSIYMSVNSTSPASFLPGTSWTQIENAYLFAKRSGDTAGSISGASDYKITKEMLPSHNHGLNSHTHTLSHTHALTESSFEIINTQEGTSGDTILSTDGYFSDSNTSTYRDKNISYSTGGDTQPTIKVTLSGNTAGASTTTTSGASGDTASTGSNQAYMPRFIAMYVWKRTG